MTPWVLLVPYMSLRRFLELDFSFLLLSHQSALLVLLPSVRVSVNASLIVRLPEFVLPVPEFVKMPSYSGKRAELPRLRQSLRGFSISVD